MTRSDPAWLDAQYNARASIPEHAEIFARWSADSAAARASTGASLDLRYGDGPNESLDVFHAQRPGAPVLVFIHGGYWRALDKREQSFLAPALVAGGAMVVLPNYALCPAVSIATIALQLTRALAWVHRNAADFGGDPQRIVVAGHSAGGHLAAMMLACRWRDVGADLPPDLVKAALAISGLFDLEPLRRAPFLQPDLRLTPADVRRLSPARFAPPRARPPLRRGRRRGERRVPAPEPAHPQRLGRVRGAGVRGRARVPSPERAGRTGRPARTVARPGARAARARRRLSPR